MKSPPKSGELIFEEAKQKIRDALAEVVAEQDATRETLLLAVYDAIKVEPGIFGVSLDVKRLVEHFVPDIRSKLAGKTARRDILPLFQAFVTPSGSRRAVRAEEAKVILGVSTFEALLKSTFLRQFQRGEEQFVELPHDIIVAAIYSNRE
jgi:hypothetical protein